MRKKDDYAFFNKVIQISESKEWSNAKSEWEVIKVTELESEDDFDSCICGHPIKEVIQLFNSKNKNEIIVGNCCVNKFFNLKDYNKIFQAVKEGRVNKAMIQDAFEAELITEWERDFMEDVWRKRKFTPKQKKVFNRIIPKILSKYKKEQNGSS